ncbi:MAG: potassium transporter TrkG [Bacteroidales bacterium]
MNWQKYYLLYDLHLQKIKRILGLISELIIFVCALSTIFSLIYFYGFNTTILNVSDTKYSFKLILGFFLMGITIRYLCNFKEVRNERLFGVEIFINSIAILYFLALSLEHAFAQTLFSIDRNIFSIILLILLSFMHSSRIIFTLFNRALKPSTLLVLSFFFIIMLGAGLLILPNASNVNLPFIDALFMATSAVCVTGLTPVDVASTFTQTGYIILLILIQIGGIGMLTFTSFFALAFMGKASFSSRMIVKDVLQENSWTGLFAILRRVILVTLTIELIGAYCIWRQIHGTLDMNLHEELFFSVFHAVSAYCNAGISTLSGNLHDPLVTGNYGLQMFVAFLIIIGGIGYPIVSNYFRLIRHYIHNVFNLLIGRQKRYDHIPHIINLHTRIVLVTTTILIVGGTALFYLFESNQYLAGLSFQGKLCTSFFGAVTPRTAGFNAFNTAALSNSTLFLMVGLMLIGASPMSTGGGLKTTTFAVALVSAFSFVRGKNSVEVARREIPIYSIQRAFAILVLYFCWAVMATFGLSISEGEAPIFTLFFEVISALSTVGLSLNFTPELSFTGKIIIILTMFVGRVGVLSFFMGIFKEVKRKYYEYPSENLLMG